MINRKNIIRNAQIVATLILVGLSIACSNSADELQQGQRVPVSFSLGFDVSVTRTSVFENVWPNNTVITISNGTDRFNYTTSSTSGSAYSGEAVSITPTDLEHQFYWPVSDPSWKFSAWYPDDNVNGPTLMMTVVPNQSVKTATNTVGIDEDVYTGWDILYMPPTSATWRSTVALALKHQLARVIVTVNTTLTEKHEKVVNIAFGGNRLGLTGIGTVSNTDGQITWAASGTSSITYMRERTTEEEKTVNRYVFECLLPPQANNTTTAELIKISTTGAIKEGTTDTPEPRTYIYKNAFDLQPGYQYTYNLVITEKGKVLLGSVELSQWDIKTGVDDIQTITR